MTFLTQCGFYLHSCVFQKISKLNEPFKGQMQFELFEKHKIANKIHIERENSYDYFLIIHMK